MSIAIRSYSGVNTPVQQVQEDNGLRTLMVICGLIAGPSLVLMLFLSGWVLYVFAVVVVVNLAVPAVAYYVSLNPPRQRLEEDRILAHQPEIVLEPVAALPLRESVVAERVADKI